MGRFGRTVMLGSLLALVCASAAGAQEPQQKPTHVAATLEVDDGRIQAAEHGQVLRIDDFSPRVATKVAGPALPGKRRFGEKTLRYLKNWRRSGGARHAVMSVDGGGKVQLNLSTPSLNGGELIFRVGRTDAAGKSATAPPQDFGSASLRVASNWYAMVARLSAVPNNENGYSCDNDRWRTGPWNCQGSGEAQNTDPWKGPSRWNSNDGGRVFQMTGFQEVGIFCPLCNADNIRYVRRTAELNGTSGSWGTSRVTINSSSSYKSLPNSLNGQCTKPVVSGSDDSLFGKPGGSLRTQLKFQGGIFQYPWYILDIRGYVSEPWPPPEDCRPTRDSGRRPKPPR